MILKAIIFIISFFIGCETFFIFSPNTNVVEQFPLGDSGIVLVVQKKHAHLFLAEYDFKFILKMGGKEFDSVVMGDSGGMSRIDVLKVGAGQFRLSHYGRNVCLTLGERSFDDYCDAQKQAIRIGHFGFDSSRQWKFIPDLD